MVKHCDLGSIPAVTSKLKTNKLIKTNFSMMTALCLETNSKFLNGRAYKI